MERWILRGSGWLLLVALLAGCGSQPAPASLSEPLEPRREPRLHLPAEPATLDSARASDTASLDLLGNVAEGLVRRGPDGTAEAGVAERWETADGRQFTFHLRDDARWADGSPVTAADFVFAWMRALNPQGGSDYAFLFYEIEGAEEWNTLDPADPDFPRESLDRRQRVKIAALDAKTLQVTLRSPNPYWANYTAHPVFYPQQASAVADQGSAYGSPGEFAANGPYVIERWTPGAEILLRKNPNYWDAEAIQAERLFLHVERDGQEALRLFDAGYLDHVVLPGELAAQRPSVESLTQPSTMGLVFNLNQPTLANQHLRQAINLALDRSSLVEEVARYSATPAAGFVPPSLGGGWTPAGWPISPRGNHPQALQHLAIARQELQIDQISLRLLHSQETASLAAAIQRSLESRLPGLTVQLDQVSFDQRLERAGQGQFDMVLAGWVADHDDPLTLLELFVTDGPANDARWASASFDALIARTRLGEGDRNEALRDAERILLDELPVLPLYHPVRHWLTGPGLKGVRYAPLGARLDLKGAVLEWWTPGRKGKPHQG